MTQAIIHESVRNRLFRDPQAEELLCVAGERYLQRYLQKGKISRGFAILSDQNLYLYGRHYRGPEGRLRRQKSASFVPLSEVERVTYVHKRSTALLILCFFFLLLSPVMVLLDLAVDLQAHTILTPLLDAVLCLLFAGVCALLYGCSKKKLLVVHKKHEEHGMDTLYFSETEERELLKQLRAAVPQAEHRQ